MHTSISTYTYIYAYIYIHLYQYVCIYLCQSVRVCIYIYQMQAPVARFNLADEYRTNAARGFKFVGGARPSSQASGFAVFSRTHSSGSHGNSRIGTFHKGDTIVLPDSSHFEFQTRDLTQIWDKFPYKVENSYGSRSGLMATGSMGQSVHY